MLHLDSITLEDFGPFKGKQKAVFPQKGGVGIFYGENMRGKTTLLNAIRFAFFGKIIGRGSREASLVNVGNWESAAEGKYGFSVVLEMTHEGHKYRLTRSCAPPSGTIPRHDSDYATGYFLVRDEDVLGPEEAKREMHRILPEQISRFFLFDGELLQEYEDLLHSDSDMGPKIRTAIERILGIPVLTSARDNMKASRDRFEKHKAIAAQGDQKTIDLGNNLADLHAQREALEADLERHKAQLADLRDDKSAVEDEMRKRERTASMLEKRDRLEGEVKELRARLDSKIAEVSIKMGAAWSSLLIDEMQAATTRLKGRESQLQVTVIRSHLFTLLADTKHEDCPLCRQRLTPEIRLRAIADVKGQSASQGDEQELAEVRRQIDVLQKSLMESKPDVLRMLWATVEQAEVDIHQKSAEIEELNRQLSGGRDDDVRRLRSDYDNLVGQIKALEDGVQSTTKALAENQTVRDRIQKQIDQKSGGRLKGASDRVALAARLQALFDEAVTVYRERLRHRVESDASAHFLSLTTEPDYKGLRINDNYGLTIIHKDGTEIPIRSAGAEHVVALSLVGALQNNAPLRGPIVIDSPFGRLDSGHRQRTLQALPNMARQVLLLAYEEELPPARAREVLKERLRAEWILKRVSARHTELAPRT